MYCCGLFVFKCHFSPPLALCWLIKSECIPLEGEKCHLVVITGSCYNLSHTFSDAGQYCLSVRVQNGVTMLQTYHEIKVWPTGELQHRASRLSEHLTASSTSGALCINSQLMRFLEA